jgi:hypothetical protein
MPTMTLNEIRQRGLEVLSRELGPVGMIRFLQMFETGYGNYSQERRQWLDDQRIEDIVQRVRQRRTLMTKRENE